MSQLELVCLAVKQNREGKSSLTQFITNPGNKAVEEAIELVKEFAKAEAKCLRAKKTRIELLQDKITGGCVHACGGRSLEAAQQLLQRHNITKDFCTVIYTTLSKGRGEYRNIFMATQPAANRLS